MIVGKHQDEMASNNGQKLLVFGLGFAQHDSRKMQQVLRHYDRMPANPGSRAALFVELTKLGKELAADEQHQMDLQKVEDWMRDGGEFPLGVTPAPIDATVRGRHDSSHLHLENGARQPFQHSNRYGPGHTIEDTEHAHYDAQDLPMDDQHAAPHGDTEIPLGETHQAWRMHEHHYESNWDGSGREQPGEDTEEDTGDGDQDMNGLSDDDDHQGWANLVPSRAAFRGRGRTLNDAEELSSTTQHQEELAIPVAAPAIRPNLTNAATVPQLRGNQQWRGNNVHGLQHRGGGIGMGMGMGLPGVMPHHGHRPRPRRPRMEHDLEEEDDDEMGGLGGWNVGHGHFALGPGRTLNDPVPEQIEEPNQDPMVDPAFDVDESGDSDSDVDDTASAGTPVGDDAEPVECPICLEEYPQSGFPKRSTITEFCDHPDKACLQCLDSSITGIVQTGALHILACPICPQKLSPKDVKEYASKNVYERYKYLKQQALRPGHYISCTHPNCGGSQAHDCNGPNGPRMVCNFCQAETCAKHRRPWHEGQTCLEFDMDPAQIERLEEEEATAKLLAKEATSICPKCGQGVTKTEGCDHMMCQCGATAHATFCIYHPNKVNLTKSQQDAARTRILGLVHGGEVSDELTRARDEFRQRRREEMRPKIAEAAEARMKLTLEQKRQQSLSLTAETPPRKRNKVKLVPAWEEGGWTKKGL
ncbi:hypothetical protein N0V82_002998 [Gnomoniopsis sp. IMI 355080]|nr:hypothetical protein N0V82_002998 [Gnomoniopsis sp. IMI 355080]